MLEENMLEPFENGESVIISFPAIVKARTFEGNGTRIVEVEASNEKVDSEGDVILQKALLDSADSFLRKGHLDIDHKSELGERMGIKDPESWIIGKPVDVRKGTGSSTFVVGEIRRALDGSFDPETRRYDAFWASLQSEPPVIWWASIYGIVQKARKCSEDDTCEMGAKRLLVESLDWRSLAFTRNPVNRNLEKAAQIVKSEIFVKAMRGFVEPDDIEELLKSGFECAFCNRLLKGPMGRAVGSWTRHLMECAGASERKANLFALAASNAVSREIF